MRIVIPTYNAAKHWPDITASLHRQGISPDQVLIVDSSSTDGTDSLALQAGYQLLSIRKEDFGHGSTRQMAASYCAEADLLIFLTQDAVLPAETSLVNLCRALSDPCVGAAYGRQAPRLAANPIERHARLFNYPERSHTRTFESRESHGIKAAFCSNSFAAYRREALVAVGGFPTDVLLAEDSVVAARLLMAGWKVVYQADAVAVHSHPLSIRQEFTRYFDTGAHHAREHWLLDTFGETYSEGSLFLRSELQYLLKKAPHLLPVSMLRTCNKLVAYRLGRLHKRLPLLLTRRISAYPAFWLKSSAEEPGGSVWKNAPKELQHTYSSALADSLGGIQGGATGGRAADTSVSL